MGNNRNSYEAFETQSEALAQAIEQRREEQAELARKHQEEIVKAQKELDKLKREQQTRLNEIYRQTATANSESNMAEQASQIANSVPAMKAAAALWRAAADRVDALVSSHLS